MSAFTQPALTYDVIKDPSSDLCQGDIVRPTDGVRAILKDVHPHFTDERYTAFLVLTQTCDLVRRRGEPCKSRYINLAVVRPLRDVLSAFLDRACKKVVIGGTTARGVYIKETKEKAHQLLERVFNQNAQAEGIFYLHPDASARIAVPSVALLQVSVALRSQEHYGELVKARTGRLAEQFQSKVGWLLGNLFSRVATPDWDEATRNEMVSAFLEASEYVADSHPRWASRDQVQAATSANVDISGKSADEITTCLAKYRRPAPKEKAIDRAVSVVREVVAGVTEDQLATVKKRLANDPVFGAACK
jgi:hypothetical protein